MIVEVKELRRVDIPLILAASHVASIDGAEKQMQDCLKQSDEVWWGTVEAVPLAVFGIIKPSVLSDQGYLWLLTTEIAEQHKFILARHSQIWVREQLRRFEVLHGHCLREARGSIRWLGWLGAIFGTPRGKVVPFMIRERADG